MNARWGKLSVTCFVWTISSLLAKDCPCRHTERVYCTCLRRTGIWVFSSLAKRQEKMSDGGRCKCLSDSNSLRKASNHLLCAIYWQVWEALLKQKVLQNYLVEPWDHILICRVIEMPLLPCAHFCLPASPELAFSSNKQSSVKVWQMWRKPLTPNWECRFGFGQIKLQKEPSQHAQHQPLSSFPWTLE